MSERTVHVWHFGDPAHMSAAIYDGVSVDEAWRGVVANSERHGHVTRLRSRTTPIDDRAWAVEINGEIDVTLPGKEPTTMYHHLRRPSDGWPMTPRTARLAAQRPTPAPTEES